VETKEAATPSQGYPKAEVDSTHAGIIFPNLPPEYPEFQQTIKNENAGVVK
jgi:hypothetical protein